MRILIGTFDIAGIITGLKSGFKSEGHKVTTLVKDIHPFLNEEYDHKILRGSSSKGRSKNKYITKAFEYIEYKKQNLKIKKLLPALIEEHDVFIFIWQSLFSDLSDYKMIKEANKKIVTLFAGSDVRHISAFRQEYEGDQSAWEKEFHEENVNLKLNYLRTAEIYSDLIYSVPDQAGLSLRPFDHFFLPFNFKHTVKNPPQKGQPLKLIHAPSRSGIKGTELIVRTIGKLKNDGIKIDFKLLRDLPNEKVIQELKHADILVDELYLHGPGMLGLEAMASGCAVATHTMSAYKNVFDPPVCPIDEKTIYENLKKLIVNEKYKSDLTSAGIKFVQEYNSPSKITAGIIEKLNSRSRTPDYKPEFFLSKYKLPENITISEENLELTKQVLLKYGMPEQTDIQGAVRKKLVPQLTDHELTLIPEWK